MIHAIRDLLVPLSQASNPGAQALQILGPQSILAVAPAGCGKTRALAERARSLVESGVVEPPQHILAVSFSNRACSNLRTQLREFFGWRYWERVTVTNFHGLGARLVKAHGSVVGVSPEIGMPEKGWRARTLHSVGVDWRRSSAVEDALRVAKANAVSDEVVLERLNQQGVPEAIEFEVRLRAENRLDYPDLLRHAERILGVGSVRALYRLHFGVVLIDEIQDLTMQQLRIALAIGSGRLTAAGDEAQGIYGFAGAQPTEIFRELHRQGVCVVQFDRSYRSAPRIIDAVNVLTNELGSTELICANPQDWPTPGTVALLRRSTPEDEATALLDRLEAVLVESPELSVGIIVRRRQRRSAIERESRRRSLDVEIWDLPTHDARIVSLLEKYVRQAIEEADLPADQVGALNQLGRIEISPDDVELLDDLALACESIQELVEERGVSVEDAVRSFRTAPPIDRPVAPGPHLLNGHLGKGQQFDWVVVVGLEEGHIPDFRARSPEGIDEELRVLHVMTSRARTGLVLTTTERVQDRYGGWHNQRDSRWLPLFEPTWTEIW